MNLMESLTKLYSVDRQVRSLRSRLESAERYLQAQNRLLEEANHRGEELKTRRLHIQAKIANLETEGAALDEKLEKFRQDLNSSVTNKQYTAVLTELNTVKEERSNIDDQILAEMEQLETLETEINEAAEHIAERERVCEVARTQLDERTHDVGDRLAELEAERATAADQVPGSELSLFEELCITHDGEAMATVEEISRRHREYACGACNLMLPFERISTLLGSNAVAVRCPACGRILYLQEEMRGTLAPK